MSHRVTALSIARLAIYAERFKPHRKDPTYNIGNTVSGAEVNLAITAASAAALASLVRRVAPSFWGSKNNSSGKGVYLLNERSGRRKTVSASEEEIMRH